MKRSSGMSGVRTSLSRATSIAAIPCEASFRPVASPKASASAISFRRTSRGDRPLRGAVRMLADECAGRHRDESPFRDKGGQLRCRMFECPVAVDDQQYGRGPRAAKPLHAFQGQGRHVPSVDRYGEQGHGIGGQCLRCSRVGQVDGADFGCCGRCAARPGDAAGYGLGTLSGGPRRREDDGTDRFRLHVACVCAGQRYGKTLRRMSLRWIPLRGVPK